MASEILRARNVWEMFLAQDVPRVVQVVDAQSGSAVDGMVGPTVRMGDFEPFHGEMKPGDVWVEEMPSESEGWAGHPGTAYVWDGSTWFGVAKVTFPKDGLSRRTVIEVDDGWTWKAGQGAEDMAVGQHPFQRVEGGSNLNPWRCGRCGAESMDREIFEGAGCMP